MALQRAIEEREKTAVELLEGGEVVHSRVIVHTVDTERSGERGVHAGIKALVPGRVVGEEADNGLLRPVNELLGSRRVGWHGQIAGDCEVGRRVERGRGRGGG